MAASAFALVCLTARADEGMWLFNQPPRALLQQRYHFDATAAWLDHLRQSSIRFNSGGSGSFISRDGLLISNHHVGADALQKLSTPSKNYLRDGFYAPTPAQEMKCLDLELNVLESIEDVTARVNAAVGTNLDASAAFAARRNVIAQIEKESLAQTGLRSDVVTLWEGGAYQLYRYKRYTDVRIVFAPEQQMAFFGGDPDNFEFPRCDLDICIFRAYENGRPAHIDNYLKFSQTGPADGDLVFVSGNPGGTSRSLTVDELDEVRDRVLPFRLVSLKWEEVMLDAWSQRSDENARRAREMVFGVKNGRKALDGRLAGLLDPELMNAKIKAESDFKSRLRSSPDGSQALAAYDRIAAATKLLGSQIVPAALLEGGSAFRCESFHIARALLRAGEERPKPNGERLHEFSDANVASLTLSLFSEKPIYTDLETVNLADSLTFMVTQLGADDPLVKKILAGQSPRARAEYLIHHTRVRDVAFRRSLYEGGSEAVDAAHDPMIEFARLVDPASRALRHTEDTQTEILHQAHAAIAAARKKIMGADDYPDATFTLRLAFGTVTGYEENGRQIAPFTHFRGLYTRAAEMHNKPPFDLTPLWGKRKSSLSLGTPLDFVSTDDIIGGNSGSPVVSRAGEFVGIIFDGNLQSLPWDYEFNDRQGRAISVDSAAIIQALEHVYRARSLAREVVLGAMAPK